MDTCAAAAGFGLISSTDSYIDCQARTFGSGVYQTLAAPGSSFSAVLTGFLTVFIALIGYNLLLGRTWTVRSATLALVKIGVVLALATSWPAYRSLAFDVVIDGPPQLETEVGASAGLMDSQRALVARLDSTDKNLSQIEYLGPGDQAQADEQQSPIPSATYAAFALGGSRAVFLVTAIGSMATVKLVAGLMLGLGPLFIAFLLFDGTRGFFEGWVRVLCGATLAGLSASIALQLELSWLSPWIEASLRRRIAGEALPTLPTELFALVLLFAVIVAASLFAGARLARAFRLPARQQILRLAPWTRPAVHSSALKRNVEHSAVTSSERTRAADLASSLATTIKREAVRLSNSNVRSSMMPAEGRANALARFSNQTPLGRSLARRSSSRVSLSANRRDELA